MIELQVGDFSLEVWPSPRRAMPDRRRADFLDDAWELVGDGFAPMVTVIDDADVEKFFFGADVGIYLLDEGRCRAVFMVDMIELESERVLYLALAAVHSSLRGRGLYLPMILVRLALGQAWGCSWWATRTANPLVVETYGRFDPYPWRDDRRTHGVAAELGAELRSRFSVGDTPAAHEFDVRTGVLTAAYPAAPYHSLPDGGGPRVRQHFADHLDFERGDAVLLLGPLEEAVDQLSPRSDELLGLPFPSVLEFLAALRHEV